MQRPFFLVFLIVASLGLKAQVSCSPADSSIFTAKMRELAKIGTSILGKGLVQVGRSFMGTPYVEKTLEVGKTETLTINFRGLDCTTFVENVLAFGLLLKEDNKSLSDFAEALKTIRYRNGVLNGHTSRLHYFTEWIRNNGKKVLVKDITSNLGGEAVHKTIDFMGKHRNLYPFLKDDGNYSEMLRIEREISKEPLCILPQEGILIHEHLIKSGDIIALATSIKGLDVTHTGIAVCQDGRIHLLHASSAGKVTITGQPLVEYLKGIKGNIGIIVARPVLEFPKIP